MPFFWRDVSGKRGTLEKCGKRSAGLRLKRGYFAGNRILREEYFHNKVWRFAHAKQRNENFLLTYVKNRGMLNLYFIYVDRGCREVL